MPTSIPELSIDTRTIYDRLVKSEIGETINYAELTALIGRNVQHEARYVLVSAMHRVESQDDMVFACVHGVGVKRLSDHEIVGIGDEALTRSRRAAKRGARKLSKIRDFNSLTDAEKISHNARLSVLGAIEAIARGSALRKIEQKISNTASSQALPLAKTLEAFKG